jgi:tetratricopeptide (TPR) repeat protein
MSEEILNKLGWREIDGEIYLPGLENKAIFSYIGKIKEYDKKIKEYECLIVHLIQLRGFAHLEQGKPAEAYDDFHYVINSDYSDDVARSEALFFIGVANIQLGNIYEALNNLNEYLEHNETSPDVIYWLGIAYYLTEHLDTAIECFDSVIKNDRVFEGAYIARGKVHILLGNWELAESDFSKILKLNPQNTEAQDFVRLIKKIREKFKC